MNIYIIITIIIIILLFLKYKNEKFENLQKCTKLCYKYKNEKLCIQDLTKCLDLSKNKVNNDCKWNKIKNLCYY